MPCSTTAVQEAVNFKVASSNLAGAVDNQTDVCYDCLVQTNLL